MIPLLVLMLIGPQLGLLNVERTACEKFYPPTNEISKTKHKCKNYPRLLRYCNLVIQFIVHAPKTHFTPLLNRPSSSAEFYCR